MQLNRPIGELSTKEFLMAKAIGIPLDTLITFVISRFSTKGAKAFAVWCVFVHVFSTFTWWAAKKTKELEEETTHDEIVAEWDKEFWNVVNDVRSSVALGPDPYNNTGRTCDLFGLRYYVVGYDNYREEYHVVRTEGTVARLVLDVERFIKEVTNLY
jgi:hypothetical protein